MGLCEGLKGGERVEVTDLRLVFEEGDLQVLRGAAGICGVQGLIRPCSASLRSMRLEPVTWAAIEALPFQISSL